MNPYLPASQFICPVCHLSTPLNPKPYGFECLPVTQISQYIEKSIRDFISYQSNIESSGLDPKIVSSSFYVRLLSNKIESVEVLQALHSSYDKSDKENFTLNGKAKVVGLFQRWKGLDILLFLLYSREYNDECNIISNRRTAYISYIDSVHYMKPYNIRTEVYHTFLNSYFSYLQQQGYTNVRIWSCPPFRGDEYIFYSHPKEQKIPSPDHLLKWYKTLLTKAQQQGIVFHVSNLYDTLKESMKWPISHSSRYSDTTIINDNLTDTELHRFIRVLPYFEGDYWPHVATQIIKEKKEKKAIPQNKKIKEENTAEIDSSFIGLPFFIYNFLERLISNKEKLIVANLYPYCNTCGDYITKESYYYCSTCKYSNIFCKMCSDNHKHQLQKLDINIQPIIENNPEITTPIIDNRQIFLRYSQSMNLQFNTIRNAVYSTSVLLYMFGNKDGLQYSGICDRCVLCIEPGKCYQCDKCSDFYLCEKCYYKEGHEHDMTKKDIA